MTNHTHTHTAKIGPTVLFFGKNGCKYSDAALALLHFLKFDVQSVVSRNRSESLPEDIGWWQGDYIFCFRSYFVIPKSLLDRAKIAAINFHPAPPEYPGSGCLNWALYENSSFYGATAHIMNDKIDNGPIIDCRRFPVFPQDTVNTLLDRAHAKTYDLMVDTLSGIALDGRKYIERKLNDFKDEKWRGKARKMREIDELQKVSLNCPEEELNRIIRATHTEAFPPFIELHGHRFYLKT